MCIYKLTTYLKDLPQEHNSKLKHNMQQFAKCTLALLLFEEIGCILYSMVMQSVNLLAHFMHVPIW